MPDNKIRHPLFAAAVTLAIAVPGGAFAYDEDSAIRDCEKRLRDESPRWCAGARTPASRNLGAPTSRQPSSETTRWRSRSCGCC